MEKNITKFLGKNGKNGLHPPQTPQSCQACMYVAGMVQTYQYCQCILQECFKHPNNIRGAYCRNASNTLVMSGCIMLQEWFKHPNHVSVCLQEQTPINMRGAYCRNASNTPIMSGVYVYCSNGSNIPILSVYVAGVLQTPQ